MALGMSIGEKIIAIKEELPDHVLLVAVSKTKPVEQILEAYEAGHRCFGENKVQELTAKSANLPADIQWHMIGHLQTNKVKYIAPFIHTIHSVDSLKLLKEINKQAAKNERMIDCLFQVRIAEEETKFGLAKAELESILNSEAFQALNNIRIVGLMGMSTNTGDAKIRLAEFNNLKEIYTAIKEDFFESSDSFKELSMGMSDDYQEAIKAGSTMVRIGSTIFGARNYAVKHS